MKTETQILQRITGLCILTTDKMSDKEVVALRAESWDEWLPDIVVGIDFGMTYTGKQAPSGLSIH